MARLSGGGKPRGDGGEADPPGGLLFFGVIGLLLALAGRAIDGDWGYPLVQAGAGLVVGGALVFFARLWSRWARRR